MLCGGDGVWGYDLCGLGWILTIEVTIGEYVLWLRRRMKLTQVEFGKLLDTCGDTIKNWELGKTEPQLADIGKLAILEQRHVGK